MEKFNIMKDGDLTNFFGGKTDNGYKLKINGEHTPTPWKLGRMGAVVSESREGIEMGGAMGKEAIKYYGGNLIGESISQANAQRIVECVNACEGIDEPMKFMKHYKAIEYMEIDKKYHNLKDVVQDVIRLIDEGREITQSSIIINAIRYAIQ